MKEYPRIGRTYRRDKNRDAKCKCGEIARYKVDIEYNHMRGDDDTVWACEAHKRDIKLLTEVR